MKAPPTMRTVNDEVVIEEALIGFWKEMVTIWLVGTPVSPSVGSVELIAVGGRPTAEPVVKVQTSGLARGWPEAFCTPVVSVAVNVVFGARLTDGVKVATRVPTS